MNIDWCHDCDNPVTGCKCDPMTDAPKLSDEELADLFARPMAAAQRVHSDWPRYWNRVLATIDDLKRELTAARGRERTPSQELLAFANEVMGTHQPGSMEYRLAEFVWVTRPCSRTAQSSLTQQDGEES